WQRPGKARCRVSACGPRDPLRCRGAIGEHNPPDDLPSPEDVVDLTGSSGCASEQQVNHTAIVRRGDDGAKTTWGRSEERKKWPPAEREGWAPSCLQSH
ncbi:MAG: hypothetical protein WAO16_08970, partial [Pseudolabrys sp.]